MAEHFSVVINGVTTNLSYNSVSGKWEGTTTAPSASSWSQTDHKYAVSVEYENAAGTTITADPTDLSHCGSGVTADNFKLRVKEKVAPTMSFLSPGAGDYINSDTVTVRVAVSDNDSGVDASTISVLIDGSPLTVTHDTGNEYVGTVSGLSDGSHTCGGSVTDNDGNTGTATSITFHTDTTQPTLTVTSPAQSAIFNTATITVSGNATDSAGGEIDTVTVSVNGGTAVELTVDAFGNFSDTVTITQGTNTVTVVATDKAGNATTITRTISADLTTPVITSFVLIPNPADGGATLTIEATISAS